MDQERYLTASAVSELTTLSRATIERKVRSGDMPRPIYISERRKAWKESAIRNGWSTGKRAWPPDEPALSSGWLETLAARAEKATPEGADIWQARSGRQEGVGEAEDSLESCC